MLNAYYFSSPGSFLPRGWFGWVVSHDKPDTNHPMFWRNEDLGAFKSFKKTIQEQTHNLLIVNK